MPITPPEREREREREREDMEQDQPGRFHSYGSKNEDSIWVKSTVDYR